MLQIKNTLGGGKSNAPYAWAKYEVIPDEILTNPSIDLSYVQSSGRINITGASFDLSFLPSVTNSNGLSPNGTDDEKQVVDFFTGFQIATNQYKLYLSNDVLTFYFEAGALPITEFHNDTDGIWFTVDVYGAYASFEKTLPFTGEKIVRRSYRNFIEYITDKSPTKYPNGEVHTDGYFYRYAPEGLYAWKKCENDTDHTFIDYIVSDKETAYPDGGEKGGCWYERVIENDLSNMVKRATETIVFDNLTFASNTSSYEIGYSDVKAVMICQLSSEVLQYADAQAFGYIRQAEDIGSNVRAYSYYYKSSETLYHSYSANASLMNGSSINFGFKAGWTYKVIIWR